ncbi:dihydropteroate synthase [Halomicrobium sp. IBSBa]|uniref:dihydropteroate synthase n=1 Tax=Halomicrobium sp. IBSBa TaxID=2778916 RepID=UPI001ABFFDC8|nr:dihydropteroate synthase [Halomicrobium sp. IBSBa]MBO4246580.1 dihydropteroate synthase [Halomicrobium sp. IBSBa]
MQNVDAAGLGIGDDYPTRIMGVLNVSRESPYDPSVFDDHDEAAAYVDEELVGEGADIVDVGLESANKRFDVLSAEQELDRLDTAIQTMESVSGDAIFSIETRYHEVAEAAIEAGFDMVNDICGFADPEMPRICREYDVAVGKMASPPDLERPGAVEETDWAARKSPSWAQQADYVDQVYEALGQNGLTDKTIVDPAFGGWSEAKTLANDRETFRRLREFRALDRPILVSINRKNFLRSLADRSTEEALPVSLAATSMAIDRGAHVVRTHDVAETLDAARIGDAFADSPLREASLGVEELDVTNGMEVARHVEAVDADFDPEDGTTRAFRITGLDPAGRESLAAAAADTNVRIAGESSVVVFGTPRSLTRLAATLDDSGRVGDVMEWIANDV